MLSTSTLIHPQFRLPFLCTQFPRTPFRFMMESIKKSSGAEVIIKDQLNQGAEVITVDVQATKNLLNQGYRYLDVRSEEEFKNGHVENALNIAYMFNTPKGRVKNPKFIDQVMALCHKEDHLVVGCQSGIRSVYATIELLHAEFKHVYNMGGGYIAWVGAQLAVKKAHPVCQVTQSKTASSDESECRQVFPQGESPTCETVEVGTLIA